MNDYTHLRRKKIFLILNLDTKSFGHILKDMPILPWLDPENFNPGYMMRSMDLLPQRGDKSEWQHTQDYWLEKKELRKVDFQDSIFICKYK